MNKEIWTSVFGYEGLYEVSNTGKIKSLKRFSPKSGRTGRWYPEKIMSLGTDKDGYKTVQLCREGKRKLHKVHRVVLSSFTNQSCDLQVNHIDGDKQNNSLENLEWATASENIKHAFVTGLKSQMGSKNNSSKLTEENVLKIIELFKEGTTPIKVIAETYSVDDETIRDIKRRRTWKHITDGIEF